MANQFNQNLMFEGLGTFTLLTAPFKGNYSVEGKITIPSISAGDGQSAVVAVLKKNGSTTLLTGIAGAQGFGSEVTLLAGDIITVVMTSANAADQGLNKIKTTVAVSYDGVASV